MSKLYCVDCGELGETGAPCPACQDDEAGGVSEIGGDLGGNPFELRVKFKELQKAIKDMAGEMGR